jgi:hypothetical protein
MMETIIHTLGLCGENHLKLIDLVGIYPHIIENKNTFKNTWPLQNK